MLSYIRLLDAVSTAIREVPQLVATEAVAFTKERFVEQNWLDGSPEPWDKRKTPRKSKQREKGAVLVSSGRLKRSIRKILVSADLVIIGTDVPYAQAHNDGFNGSVKQRVRQHTRAITKHGITHKKQQKNSTRITFGRVKTGDAQVRAHDRTITQQTPRRRFIGQSSTLNTRIENTITKHLETAILNVKF